MEKLNLFFIKIKGLTFWQRLFSWQSLRNLSYDAFDEFKSIQRNLLEKEEQLHLLEKKILQFETRNEALTESVDHFEKMNLKNEEEINLLNHKMEALVTEKSELKNANLKHENTEEQREINYRNNIGQLNQLKQTLEEQIKKHNDERLEEQRESFEKMKRQWSEHEATVEQNIRMICKNHFIRYVDVVPFRGNPDNTLEICEEFIVFDAKCPSNNDLINFPKYIKAQTESLRKYANQEKVKKDIFLVVPTNTIHTIKQFVYNMGDYNVYVITIDSLESIILTLKKIEDYEFVNQLSPDERDNICRLIGKFAHTTKRKIQVDQFFASEFLELLSRYMKDLPEDFLKQIIEFEKAEKLNPPAEKQAKQILTKELQEKHAVINAEALVRKISTPSGFEAISNLK